MTQYTKEFREQAILLSDEIGVKKAAEQLGVVYSTLVDVNASEIFPEFAGFRFPLLDKKIY